MIVAAPVAAPESIDALVDADDVVCVSAPRSFHAVGAYYDDFSETTDDDVVACLAGGAARA